MGTNVDGVISSFEISTFVHFFSPSSPMPSAKTIRPTIRESESRLADFSLEASAIAKRSAGRAETTRTCLSKKKA